MRAEKISALTSWLTKQELSGAIITNIYTIISNQNQIANAYNINYKCFHHCFTLLQEKIHHDESDTMYLYKISQELVSCMQKKSVH
ncbi:hypothetical protein [Leuconostoc mesenteroides]|uniref:hypothetical protein n=1 Tax=Leuconostoc mesenteroides TaxID=1245 RepID=UPI000A067B6E|nr:hypothetical protein [Leuconostoc mesenteroides]ORI60725.1 hypothetical protein BMS69_08315 [Leuconostoc mesenteroides subsp. cremoris]